jgi:hypothetical protein
MLLRSLATIVVVGVACVLFPRNDADARGGGFHGGMGAGFHLGGGHFGVQGGHPMMRNGMHRSLAQHAERNHRGGRRTSNHFTRVDFGHWHRSFGFGSSVRRNSIADGQWHSGGEFR